MVPIKVICNLIHEDKSALRAALLRNGCVSTLVHHIEDADALIALHQLALKRSSHAHIRKHACFLIQQLCRETVHSYRSSLLCYILLCADARSLSRRMRERLASATIIHLDPKQPNLWLMLLDKALYPAMPLHRILDTLSFDLYDVSCFPMYARICSHSSASAKYIIETFGQRMLALVQTDVAIGSILHSHLLMHMRVEWYDRSLLDVADISESVPLISRFVNMNPSILREMRTDREFGSLVAVMCQALGMEHLRVYAQTFLLQVMISTPTALPQRAIDAFAVHIAKHPSVFTVNIENAPPEALENVLNAGKQLGVDDAILAPIRLRLMDLIEENRQAHRRQALGLSMEQPDAFACPVTMEVMRDPVIGSDGHTYERQTLIRLLATTRVSPLTREKLKPNIIIPNHNLRKRIREYSDDLCAVIERRQLDEALHRPGRFNRISMRQQKDESDDEAHGE